MRWAIQKNLIHEEDLERLMKACRASKHVKATYVFNSVPFSGKIPAIPKNGLTIWYGTTSLMTLISELGTWVPGVFFNENKFNCWSYDTAYGEEFFNHGCEFTTIGEIKGMNYPEDREFFVRPLRDGKEFPGGIFKFGGLLKWSHTLGMENPTVNESTKIIMAEPFAISHEWRLFMVGGKVSSGSHYREYMRLKPSADLPAHVVEYAEKMDRVWSPAPVYVMDIAESGDELRILEVNCFNSSGFYESDVDKIVDDVSNLVVSRAERWLKGDPAWSLADGILTKTVLGEAYGEYQPPEFVGKFPIRQGLTVLPADPPGKPLIGL